MRSSSGIDICNVNAPIAESRYGAESARSFGIKSQISTTIAKITIAATHCGMRAANGPSHKKNQTQNH